MSHRVTAPLAERLANAVPFGLGRTKPQHFRDMARVIWDNRDNLGYAWQVLSKGVCDGCALGVAGLHDWTIDGVHLCMTRLNLLRLNTMPALDHDRLADLAPLRTLDNAQLRQLGRLAYPMLRERGQPGFRRVTWDEAYGRLARRLRGADPRRLAFFVTSRGVTNEVYYVAQKVARFLGTNHVDNAARLCHSPSTGAMKHALGYAASTCSYRDWYGTDLVVFWGANPANDQPVTTKYLHEAKALGTKVALVNPYLEPGMKRYWVPSTARSAVFGTALADWWFPVSQGGDIAFITGVLKELVARGGVNREFIARHAADWPELEADLARHDFATLERRSGLTRAAMAEFAELLAGARNAVFVWSMGITQHAYGGDAVSAVLNLGLARGYVGRPLNGLMPIRGHSSVQGGAEMGAYATAFPGGQPVNAANAAALAAQYGFPVPDWPGYTAVEMVEAAARGQLDALYCLGGNFLRTLPEPDHVARALARVPLRVHQDLILTDQMFLEPGEEVLLLPAQTRYEQEGGGIETTTERRIAFSPEIPRQVGEARAEWRILRELAALTRPDQAHLLGCESGPAIRAEIARVVPFYEGCQHLTRTGEAVQYGGPRLCDDGAFATPDGKAHFRVVEVPAEPVRRVGGGGGHPAAGPEFVVSTRRGKQFNTLIYAEVDPLTGAARDAVFMNPDDAAALRLLGGDRVALVNPHGRHEGRVFLAPLARGNLQVHWPEANHLLPRGVVDAVGGVPDYNAAVRVERL
jgi:molybdopterin-dependent oxidoreductase alpha subunit